MNSELEDIAEEYPNIYRECADKFFPVLHSSMEWCSTSREKMWACMFALDHPQCMGRSMTDVSTQIGVSRATVSELATRFCENNNLPPSSYMKTERAQEMARHIRNTIVERNQKQ